jgi:two-component system chemotaxis response regulator CheY
VLIVDDDSDIRLSVHDLVAAAGYDAETAIDGQDAIERLVRGRRPDLMILDLKMPRKSGYEVLSAIQTSTLLLGMPIIVLSAYLEAPPAGAVAWLRKPIKPTALLGAVENYLRAA